MAESLRGAVVVIAGASSGIGRAAAHRFADEGARLVLAARRAPELEAAASECRERGAEALVVPTDVSGHLAVDELARRAIERFGHIDVWVNCAAVLQYGRFEDMPAEVVRRLIETNVIGQFNGSQTAIRHFRGRGRGVLINTGSVLGLVGHAYTAAYAASKFAILGLNSSLREELQDEPHIHLCEVLPAAIDTPIYRRTANYTGHAIQPMQPLYPADLPARGIVSLAKRPRARAYAGSFGRAAAIAHLVAPRLLERLVRIVPEVMELRRERAPDTPGNVFAPVSDAYAVDGGWRKELAARTARKAAPVLIGGALAAAALGLGATGLVLAGRRRR